MFSIGSTSSAFAAAAIFKLVDDGKLTLDARAGETIPELSGRASQVTIRQLLLHSSGLRGSLGHDHRRRGGAAAAPALLAGVTVIAGYVRATAARRHR